MSSILKPGSIVSSAIPFVANTVADNPPSLPPADSTYTAKPSQTVPLVQGTSDDKRTGPYRSYLKYFRPTLGSTVIVFPKFPPIGGGGDKLDKSNVRMRTARNVWRYRVLTSFVRVILSTLAVVCGAGSIAALTLGGPPLIPILAIPTCYMLITTPRRVQGYGKHGLHLYKVSSPYHLRPFSTWLDRFRADLFLVRKNILSLDDLKQTIEEGTSPEPLKLSNHPAAVEPEHLREYLGLLGKEPWVARVLMMLEEAGNTKIPTAVADVPIRWPRFSLLQRRHGLDVPTPELASWLAKHNNKSAADWLNGEKR